MTMKFYTKYTQKFLDVNLNKRSVKEVCEQFRKMGFERKSNCFGTKYVGYVNGNKASITLCDNGSEENYIKTVIINYDGFENFDKATELYNNLISQYQNNSNYISEEYSTEVFKKLCSDNNVVLLREKNLKSDNYFVSQIIHTNGSDWVDQLVKDLKNKYCKNPIPAQYEDIFNKIKKLIEECE